MANGYEQEATKVVVIEGEVRKVRYKEQIPKSITAAKFWAVNRDRENWGKDPERSDGSGGSGGSGTMANVMNINLIKGMSTEQLRQTMQVLRQIMTPNPTLRRLDIVDAEVELELDKSDTSEDPEATNAT